MAYERVSRVLLKPRNVVLLTGGILAIKIFPDAFPQLISRPLYQGYHGGRVRKLQDLQLEEFQEVCRNLGVDAERYHLFVTGRWDIKAKGVSWMPNGVQFGIPVHFVEEPSIASIRFSDPIKTNLDTKEGQLFQESFNLSKPARQFALASEVARIESGHTIAKACLLPTFIAVGYVTTFAALPMLNFLPRFVALLGIGSVYMIIYRFSLGQINESIDLRMDRKVANLSPTYANGGLEYYEKRIQKNIALRVLLESKGKKMYSYYGNEHQGIFYSASAPLTSRKDAIKKIVQQNNKNRN
ncbi:transmembrane protein 177-like [Anneissia japonica]|uniref:transmembrane protein 177-like n=1 Tax=Anneissia japonica TaxID=1529436 RepID=UPI0014259248|nr:transmembrane protein 177-like [Anneissia japonica]